MQLTRSSGRNPRSAGVPLLWKWSLKSIRRNLLECVGLKGLTSLTVMTDSLLKCLLEVLWLGISLAGNSGLKCSVPVVPHKAVAEVSE